MKTGRNDPCICGSGLKYKKCCIDKSLEVYTKSNNNIKKIQINPFFEKYNSLDLLQTIAGLSIIPENQGKDVRMEEFALNVIRNFNNQKEKPSSKELNEFLENEYSHHYLEDPPVNLFTDLVTFYGGDYLLFPGMTENGGFILTTLLAAVFQWPKSGIPKQFVINCKHKVSLLLAVSNTLALKLGYTRYLEGTTKVEKIEVPNDDSLNSLKSAVTFTIDEMELLFKEHSIERESIGEFLIDINSADISSPHIEESPLVFKPILYIEEKFIIVSPATLSLAIIDNIWSSAQSAGCMNEVNITYHNVLWNNLQMQLGQMKFNRIDVEGIFLNEKEGLYRFDDDKIAYIQYLGDKGANYKVKDSDLRDAFGKLEIEKSHKEEVIEQLLASPELYSHEILDMIIISPIGREFFYPVKRVEHARTIAIPMFELDVLWSLKDTMALDLWKFAIAKEEQMPDARIMSFSFLDQYKIYKDHQDSFYLSDEKKFDSIHIESGYSGELIKQSIHKTDKHSVLKNINGRISNVQLIRSDDYTPIYVDLMGLLGSELEFMVEGFFQAVWVTPNKDIKKVNGEIRNMYWQFNDTIAYWLWQIQDNIQEDLKLLGFKPIVISFDLIPLEKFETVERNFNRDPNLTDRFQTEASKDSCNIIIPAEIIPYLYGTDNQGERVLVKHLLIALNKLLEANEKPLISNERINNIIESKAPLGMKKKVFILDTNDNLLLDPRNLIDYRYVQKYDTGVVLDSIIPALGKLCPPVGKIETQKERDDLSFKIGQNSLLPILRNKISQYNSTVLLKRLISQNESLIRKREELRVQTPTRIACFVSSEQHQIDLNKNLTTLSRTTIALRCLIEFIAAEPNKGAKIVSLAAIDELVAIMDQIISWGSLSDQIHFNLFDIKMGVLPSKRIGTEKKQIKEVFDPYHESKTKENISDAISTFNQVFPQIEKFQGKEVPENLDKAFIADYGISFSRICHFIEGLVHIGFLQTTPYASLPLIELREEVNKYVDYFDEPEFQSAIDYLALINRGKIEELPKGYEFIDIMPWRFNRMLSFIRKPIVLVDAETPGGSKMVYWGVRHLLSSRLYLVDQFLSDRLRVFENSEVKKVLGKFAKERGDALAKKIVDSIDPVGLIVDQEIYIGPGHSLKNKIDIGDIDVLVIDPKNKILFSLESKSMSPSRNIKEMIEEVEKLFGSKSEMGWIDKHLRRHNWIEANKDQISKKYKTDISAFAIKSFFITNEDMLTPYLRKQTLPIPFITSYEIEKEGYKILMKMK